METAVAIVLIAAGAVVLWGSDQEQQQAVCVLAKCEIRIDETDRIHPAEPLRDSH